MDACDDLIRRIVSQSGIMTPRGRRDLQRELRAHLEDAIEEARSQGYDEANIPRIICDRFGDPDEIAHEFALAHRVERRAISMVYSVAWLGLSMLTVAGLILALQLAVAVCSGMSPSNAFSHLREEMISFGSLALGYMGLYLEERLFQNRRFIKAFAVNSALFTFLFTLTFFAMHLTALTPVLAFVSGVAVRALQQTVIRRAWFLGTAIPMAMACLIAGPLVDAHSRFPLWAAALVKWTGLTAACYVLTLLSRNHHARHKTH